MSKYQTIAVTFTSLWIIGQATAESNLPNPLLRPLRGVNSLFGGGNFYPDASDTQFQVLQNLGAGQCRLVFDNFYQDGKATPNVLDGVVWNAYKHGVIPMILFEHYVDVHGDFGGKQKWFDIGKAFATRFRPNGEFWKMKGVEGVGIKVYSAINEPDLQPGLNKEHYVEALQGLGEGVHSVDKSLQVHPGGFMSANAHKDWTLDGFAPLLAPLWNQGILDGVDLHTYYDVEYAKIQGMYGSSAQANFDSVKVHNGITADLKFYATEFNFKNRLISENQAAKGLLTGIWDNLGVVKNDGHTPATVYAFVWNLFNGNDDPVYGLAMQSGVNLTARAKVVNKVLEISKDMVWIWLDPKGTGVYILGGKGRKLWVWQNLKKWSSQPGSEFLLNGIPKGTTKIEVIGWDGTRQTLNPNGSASLKVTNLVSEETYMFYATGFTEDLTMSIIIAPSARAIRKPRSLSIQQDNLLRWTISSDISIDALGRLPQKSLSIAPKETARLP